MHPRPPSPWQTQATQSEKNRKPHYQLITSVLEIINPQSGEQATVLR